MTKNFCDLCSEPADRAETLVYVYQDVPEPMKIGYIRMALHFSYQGHPTGFGGPPDLCGACKKMLWAKFMEYTT